MKIAHAWETLIVCDGTKADPCTFNKLIELAQNIITDLVILATLAATAGFIIVGFRLLFSGGNPGALSEAKEMFRKILLGFLWILVAWVVVYTITSALLNPEFNIVIGKPK
jgi:hypothetical protein